MPLFKRITVYSFFAITSLALVFVLLVAFSFMEKEDGFFLEGAELREPNYLLDLATKLRADSLAYFNDKNLTPVRAHRIRQGQGTIFAYRRFFPGGMPDSQGYEKLTIWIAPNTVLKNAVLDLSDPTKIIAVVSSGNSVFHENGCSGYLSSGVVRIEGSDSWYRVTIRAILDAKALLPRFLECSGMKIEHQFGTQRLKHEDITPWLGRTGSHIFEETFRRGVVW